ncbi:MAG: universal stress protein [Gammaproteobacteria bacterium]|nr:universal stress protein [Pseudomonadales bacterium]MCP5345392.1 universal stress protein [Pseudomonadales bacterium]
MSTKNRILIVLDVHEDFRQGPDDFPIEIEKALRFVSDKSKTELIIIGCGFEEYLHESYSSYARDEVDIRKQYIQKLEERLARVTQHLNEQGYRVTSKIHWAYPRYEQVAREADEFDVDLVVQHVNRNEDEEHPVLSNDTWQLVRSCKRPLLLVRDKAWPSKPVLLAAVDPTHKEQKRIQLDNRIMEAALTAEQELDGELHVVHACSAGAHPFSSPDKIVAEHQEALDEFMGGYDIAQGYVHLSKDKPIMALLNLKKELHVDVIVMGVISKSRMSEALVGHTAQGVLDYLHADVLVLRP